MLNYLKHKNILIENYDIFSKIYYSYFNEQHTYLFTYTAICLILTVILFSVAFVLSPKKLNFEKNSSYECGFEPFGDGHSTFNIQFFVVGILFMIFDLELAYLFPWIINLGNLPLFSFFLMVFFLILLTVGFIYEWKKKALDWL